jgi:anthranilate synthase/aminodeoxychorismate synthase-like glutamine amidotransferase
MTVLIVDNFDSFVFNIARYVRELGHAVEVIRNDDRREFGDLLFDKTALIISPGPCSPSEAGISNELIAFAAGGLPVLGVCLGHQCIGEVFGAQVHRAREPMHGRSSFVRHDGSGLFLGLPSPLRVGRYHSLIVSVAPTDHAMLIVTGVSEGGEVMAVRHKSLPIFGVQFHPESVLTEHGHAILRNFMDCAA